MTGINSRSTRDPSRGNRRNNQSSHLTHKQAFGNKPLKPNDLDDLMSQSPSFTQLDIDDTITRSHVGLGYDSRFITANNGSTAIKSMPTKRFVPASQNLAATDPLLQQQNNSCSTPDHEPSGETLGLTITESDIDQISCNDNSKQTRLVDSDINTNSKQQPGMTLKLQGRDSVPLGANVNALTMPTDTHSIGVITDHTLLPNDGSETCREHDDQQQHWMENFDEGDRYERPIQLQHSDEEEDVFDFGLCDSDDDEYIQASVAYQQYQQYSFQIQYNNQYHAPNPYQQKPKHHWYEDSPSGQLRRIDRRVQLFISDPSRETYQLPGMSTYCRRQVQGLTTLYKLKMAHEDVGNDKIGPLLKKGPKTQLPTDRRAIEKHINKIRTVEKAKRQMERRPGGAASEILNRTRKEERQRRKGLHTSELTPESTMTTLPASELASKSTKKSAKQSNNRMVGSEAVPLASHNIGHRIMASMGWKEGDSLGVNNDGIANPIQPVIRTNRRGLGA